MCKDSACPEPYFLTVIKVLFYHEEYLDNKNALED